MNGSGFFWNHILQSCHIVCVFLLFYGVGYDFRFATYSPQYPHPKSPMVKRKYTQIFRFSHCLIYAQFKCQCYRRHKDYTSGKSEIYSVKMCNSYQYLESYTHVEFRIHMRIFLYSDILINNHSQNFLTWYKDNILILSLYDIKTIYWYCLYIR